MKKIFLVMIILSLLVSGCENKSLEGTQKENHAPQNYSFPDSREIFSISSPDWEAIPSDDPFNNITLRSGQCSYALNVLDAPQDWYEKAVKEFIKNKSGTILTESPLSYTLTGDGYTFKTRTKALFCDDRTNKKLGLLVSPQNATDIKSYYRAFNLARDNRVQMTHQYSSWGENNWVNNDLIFGTIKNKGLKTSVAFSVIHTSVIGKLPEDIEFRGWDDAALIFRFSDFAIDYIERYRDVIEYVEIGNEVDIYFYNHKDELGSYKIFYKKVYDNIKKAHPDVKVGTVFAYHTLKSNNNFDVYRTLSPIGDFDAFTLYIYNPGFVFDREPIEIYKHLQEIEKLTGDRKFALEEVGWNAYGGLGGTEEAAKSFIEPGDPILKNDELMSDFSDFIKKQIIF